MIPKIIHYCWFGDKKIPGRMKRYIKGWEAMHPKFQFVKWSEENCPTDSLYLNTALNNRKWANASNFIRLYALRQHGGIYLDTDIEIVKPFDPFLVYPCFLGFEKRTAESDCVNNAVVGAIRGHKFIDRCYTELLYNFDGLELANLSSPVLTTKVLRSNINLKYGKIFLKEWDLQLFPLETFYAFEYGEKVNRKLIGDDTFSIHHYMASWHPRDRMKWFRKLKSTAVQIRSQLLNPFK